MESTAEPILKSSSIDHLIESCIGSIGFYQIFQPTLISFALAFDVQQTFNVFANTNPTWHCSNPEDSSCTSAASPCALPEGTWSWDQPKHISITSEWNLQCLPIISGLPASSYFTGCFIGGLFLSTLSDSWLGRKNMLFLSCLSMSSFSALTALSKNVWMYSFLKFITGIARANVPTTALVLATEIVGKQQREMITTFCFIFSPLGFLSLPAIAYLNRGYSWRYLYLWTSAPFIFYSITLYFCVHESPRWLLVQGHRDEAIKTLKSLSRYNKSEVDFNFMNHEFIEDQKWNVNAYSTMKVLWEKKWAFRRISAVMVSGFGVGMAYYGLPLNLGNLGSNLYISMMYNALSEIPSTLLTYVVIAKMKRRAGMLLLTTVSCAGCMLCVFLTSDEVQLTINIISYVTVTVAFCVIMTYSIELFPTCIKNSAVSMLRQATMVGAVIAPIVVAEGRKKTVWSFGVFGIVIGVCGLFVVCLPETKGSRATDTIEDEERKLNVVSEDSELNY